MFDKESDDRNNFEEDPRGRPPDSGLHDGCLGLATRVAHQLEDIITSGDQTQLRHAINEIERHQASFCAMQSKLAYAYEKAVVLDHEERGVYLDQSERGAAAQVAIARRRAPTGSRNYLVNSRILAEDTPFLASQFELGELSERQVWAITNVLQTVNAEHRREFDALYRSHPDMFEGQGTGYITDTVQRFAQRFESTSKAFQVEDVAAQRYTHFRKADGCIMLNAKLPLAEGVALEKALRERAEQAQRQGDPRTIDQLMTDQLVKQAVDGDPEKLPLFVDIKLIMTDRALFMGDREPAYLPGYGFVPAQYARELVAGAQVRVDDHFHQYSEHDDLAQRIHTFPEIQRIFTSPGNQDLIAMDSKARFFPPGLKDFIKIRDVHCRTPYCDGIPTQTDHVFQHHLGGPTNVANASLRCSFCNLAKEQPGWVEVVTHEQPHSMRINTGDGATYQSLVPPATGVVREIEPLIFPRASWLQNE